MDKEMEEIYKLFTETLGFLNEATKKMACLQGKIRQKFQKEQLKFDFTDYNKVTLLFNQRLIINDIKFLLSRGVYAKDAFVLISKHRKISSELVGWIWKGYKDKEKPLLLYGKRLTAFTLKQAGIKADKIADILKVSIKQVHKMIKNIKNKDEYIQKWLGFPQEATTNDDDKAYYSVFMEYLKYNANPKNKMLYEL